MFVMMQGTPTLSQAISGYVGGVQGHIYGAVIPHTSITPTKQNRASLGLSYRAKPSLLLGSFSPWVLEAIPLHRGSLASDGGKTPRAGAAQPEPRAPFVSFAYVGQKQLLQYQND